RPRDERLDSCVGLEGAQPCKVPLGVVHHVVRASCGVVDQTLCASRLLHALRAPDAVDDALPRLPSGTCIELAYARSACVGALPLDLEEFLQLGSALGTGRWRLQARAGVRIESARAAGRVDARPPCSLVAAARDRR